jgi:hypothetical protein
MRIYIPENLDIFKLTNSIPPTFKPYKIDKLCYILHLINAIPLMDKDIQNEEFVPINAKKHQHYIQNYKKYLTYLEDDLKIIESDNHYIVGEKSKGYRFTKEYLTPVKQMQVEDFVFRNKLKAYKNRKKDSVKHLKFLTKWFNPKLQIDYKYVDDFLVEEYSLKMKNKELWDYDRKNKKHKHPRNQMIHAQMSAERLKWQDHSLVLDDNVYRLHTNLTNMASRIRNAVTYDGQKLISIDIKNSQPYLSTILFSRSFWVAEKNEANNKNSLSIVFDELKNHKNHSFNNKAVITKEKLNIKYINLHYNDSYIMVGDIDKSLMNKEFSQFINLVVSGTLYEFLEEQFSKHLGESFSNRKEVKTAVFQVLFTDNRFLGQEEAKPKKLFKELFPQVYEVFRKIKSKDSTLLPRLLQSIESYLIIDVISKRISKEYPNAPLFTIHDSISTTAEYLDVVEAIMKEELCKAIGHAPKLAREEWCKSNMVKHLEDLKRQPKIAV